MVPPKIHQATEVQAKIKIRAKMRRAIGSAPLFAETMAQGTCICQVLYIIKYQRQAGRVGAGDEQDEGKQPTSSSAGVAPAAYQVFMQRQGDGVDFVVRIGVLLPKPRRDGQQVGAALLDAGPEYGFALRSVCRRGYACALSGGLYGPRPVHPAQRQVRAADRLLRGHRRSRDAEDR